MSEKLKQFENEQHQIAINLLKDRLDKQGIFKELPDLNIHYIGNNILCTEREGNIKIFYKYENGNFEVIFNLKSQRENYFFIPGMIYSGYKEKKNDKGENELYEILEINGKPYMQGLQSLANADLSKVEIKYGKKVDKYSLEYFKARQDIRCYIHRLGASSLQLSTGNINDKKDNGSPLTNEKGFYYISDKLINVQIDSGALRLKDLINYHKNGQITKEMFTKYFAKAKGLLKQQIDDERMMKFGDYVTKKEIQNYEEQGYITKQEKQEYFELIDNRNKKFKLKEVSLNEDKTKLSELENEIKIS